MSVASGAMADIRASTLIQTASGARLGAGSKRRGIWTPRFLFGLR
jgi:hypothetical protein